MLELEKQLINKRILKVFYSEVNKQNRTFFNNGFDVFDYGINIEFEDNFILHFYWKEDEFFELGLGKYFANSSINLDDIKIIEATHNWKDFLKLKIENVDIDYFDEAKILASSVKITFENKKQIIILVGEAIDEGNIIPIPFEYDLLGEIYVFFDLSLLEKIKSPNS